MKVVICFFALVALAAAGIVKDFIPIVSHESTIDHDGKFHYSYESADGTKAEEHGELKVFDKDHVAQVVQGRFAYAGDDGKTYTLTYTADENGYRPEGAHLPVAPPVPEAILRSLAYIAAHPAKEDNKKF